MWNGFISRTFPFRLNRLGLQPSLHLRCSVYFFDPSGIRAHISFIIAFPAFKTMRKSKWLCVKQTYLSRCFPFFKPSYVRSFVRSCVRSFVGWLHRQLHSKTVYINSLRANMSNLWIHPQLRYDIAWARVCLFDEKICRINDAVNISNDEREW